MAATRICSVITLALFVTFSYGSARPATGCQSKGEQLFRHLFERALSGNDASLLDSAVAPEFIFHAGGQTAKITREQLWQLTGEIRSGFPDIRFKVEDVISERDKVAARISFTGTHKGDWNGIPPTGKRVYVTEMFICRVKANLLAECWQEWDERGLIRQLGMDK